MAKMGVLQSWPTPSYLFSKFARIGPNSKTSEETLNCVKHVAHNIRTIQGNTKGFLIFFDPFAVVKQNFAMSCDEKYFQDFAPCNFIYRYLS